MKYKTKNAAIRAAGRVDLETICRMVSQETGIPCSTLNAASRHVFGTIRRILESQQEVEIADFGRYALVPCKERISTNVNCPVGPKSYTPPTTVIRFRPDPHWLNWQRVHSARIPDELSAGTQLSCDFRHSSYIQQTLDNS